MSQAQKQQAQNNLQANYAALKDFLHQYNRVAEDCFMECINDFKTESVGDSELKCAENCLEKFLKTTQRLSIRFQEHQMINQELSGPAGR